MRDYSKVSPKFWIGKTGRDIKSKGPEAVIVAMYLMTSPHSNMLGLYYCPMPFIIHETGLSSQGASKGLQRGIEAGFCAYDTRSEVIWVYEMAKFQVGGRLKENDNMVKGVQKEYEGLPECPFLHGFFVKYRDRFHLRFSRGSEGATKGVRSQEQEQEQEQEKEAYCSEPRDDSEPPASNVTDEPEIDNEQHEPAVMVFPLLKKFGDFPVLQKDVDEWQETFPGIDVAQELKVIRQWSVDNPTRRKSKQGIRKHISGWLAKEQDRRGRDPGGGGRQLVNGKERCGQCLYNSRGKKCRNLADDGFDPKKCRAFVVFS